MAERKTKENSIKNAGVHVDLLSVVLLCLIYSAGMLLTGFRMIPFQRTIQLRLIVLSWAAVLAGGLFCHMFRQYKKFGCLVPLAGAFADVLYHGPVRMMSGLFGFCNVLIADWNQRYQDGIPFVGNGQMEETALAAFYLLFLLVLIALFWYLTEHGNFVWIFVMMFLGIVPEIVLRQSSSLGVMLLLICMTGAWMLFFQAGSRLRRLMWISCLGVLLTGVSLFAGARQIKPVLQLQRQIAEMASTFRYGKTSLPEGNLKKAGQMQEGDQDALLVTTDQIKSLYFQGFTGAEYADGQWSSLKKADYGKERWGFLKWLSEHAFDVNAQYAAYLEAGDAASRGDMPENHIVVENIGANRKYVYTVYSAEALSDSMIHSNRDAGYRSKGLFGNWKYEMNERSLDIPGELQQLGGWVYDPENDTQKQYLSGESIYRDFVYEHYLDIPQQLKPELEHLFSDPSGMGENAQTEEREKQSIYSITQEIRGVMETQFLYQKNPDPSENTDLLLEFLRGRVSGNSAYYASAGVLAFRSYGIPARYAEGYYLGKEQIEESENGQVRLTSNDAHAWTEVYMDGMGWIPVDFTPGFYYNTYALLRMAQLPQNIRKTAAMEDSGEEAENVTGDTPQTKGRDSRLPSPQKEFVLAAEGFLLLILAAAELLVLYLEIRRLLYERQIRMKPGPKGYDADFISTQIARNLTALGIEVRPGWHAGETDRNVCLCLPDIAPGTYSRVNTVLEKYIYGDGNLEPEELRLLHCFLIAVRESRKCVSFRYRLRSRYITLVHG